jgi:hypothetical protein
MRAFIGVVMAALLLSGCASMSDHQRNSIAAAAAGAGLGAAIGFATAGTGVAIAAGAVAGGATAGVLAGYATPQGCFFRNKRGELWKVPCEDPRIKAEACFTGSPGALTEVHCPWHRKPSQS